MKDKFGEGYRHFFYFFSNDRAYMYYDRQDWEKICAGYYRKITSRETLERLIEEHHSAYQKLVTNTAYDESKLEVLPVSKLINLFKKLCNRLINAAGPAHGIEGITYGSEKKLQKLLNRKGTFNEQEFGLICSPVYPSFLSEAQKELRHIKSLSSDEKDPAMDKFIKDYGWIENTYLGRKKFSLTDITNRINSLQDDLPSFDTQQVASQKAQLLARLKLSNEENFIITTIELCFHWQDERKKYILQSISALEPVLEKISERLDIDAVSLKFANPNEISESNLENETFRLELKKRREKSACYSIPGQNFIFSNSDFDFLSEKLNVMLDNGLKEIIKGSVACPGIVRGIVKICESVSDIDKIQDGEILVASMTRPEYLPAMQRASAFVTDEGGITCHAAIVSRELGKPCIIGTKIATKFLKDGDLVEVDANNGVIKFLKSNV